MKEAIEKFVKMMDEKRTALNEIRNSSIYKDTFKQAAESICLQFMKAYDSPEFQALKDSLQDDAEIRDEWIKSQKEEWISHNGKGQPISDYFEVYVKKRNGEIDRNEKEFKLAKDHCWLWSVEFPRDEEVISYHIVKRLPKLSTEKVATTSAGLPDPNLDYTLKDFKKFKANYKMQDHIAEVDKKDDWILYNGEGQPVGDDVMVEVKYRSGTFPEAGIAKLWDWDWEWLDSEGDKYDIIAYRIVKEEPSTEKREFFSEHEAKLTGKHVNYCRWCKMYITYTGLQGHDCEEKRKARKAGLVMGSGGKRKEDK